MSAASSTLKSDGLDVAAYCAVMGVSAHTSDRSLLAWVRDTLDGLVHLTTQAFGYRTRGMPAPLDR